MRPRVPQRRLLVALLATSLLVSPSAAYAWGSAGHRAIGEMAWHFLTPEAEARVARLLEPGPYGTLAAASYWADAHARLYSTFDAYLRRHYVNVDPGATAIDMARDCPEDCILTAIEMLAERLRADEPPLWERAQDFRFLIHFVEDLHQPLHVVHPDGRGGNRIQVSLFGEETNLHRVWDGGLIEHRLNAYGPDDSWGEDTVPRWRNWAYDLRLSITPDEVHEWSSSLDPIVWATESLAPSRQLTFDVPTGGSLGDVYYQDALPVVEESVKKAAVRLAALLNDIFATDLSD